MGEGVFSSDDVEGLSGLRVARGIVEGVEDLVIGSFVGRRRSDRAILIGCVDEDVVLALRCRVVL